MNRKHSGFIASEGINGWYTTVIDNEVIEFEYPISSLLVESNDVELAVKIDGFKDIWYVGVNTSEGIEGLIIKKIQILNPLGTKIRWKALI